LGSHTPLYLRSSVVGFNVMFVPKTLDNDLPPHRVVSGRFSNIALVSLDSWHVDELFIANPTRQCSLFSVCCT
ncbi:hypothetical protein VIGAN_04368200, partial [Vigna angularis var. angularis]